jgi:hypothetical protein
MIKVGQHTKQLAATCSCDLLYLQSALAGVKRGCVLVQLVQKCESIEMAKGSTTSKQHLQCSGHIV